MSFVLAALLQLANPLAAESAPAPAAQANTATAPAERLKEGWWKTRHEAVLKKLDPATEIVFIGDSITQGWESAGKKAFEASFSGWKTLNLGFGGDRTEHVLWRFANGELEGLKPKLAVLMIGTNNTGHHKQAAVETAAGIEKILAEYHAKCPGSKVLLCSILPRSAKPDDAARKINDEINRIISGFPAKMDFVTYKDMNSLFLDKEGILHKEIMPDLLHPRAKGYQIWADALVPEIKKLLP
ncbi:MAG: hypothetical protein RL095_3140 [Verrucomicrobiota bacterium]|jgi:lysophospholipase L1-like esterase